MKYFLQFTQSLIIIFLIAYVNPVISQEFGAIDAPKAPGEREIKLTINLQGKQLNQVKARLLYSNDSAAVTNRSQTNKFSILDLVKPIRHVGNDRAEVITIFPHSDNKVQGKAIYKGGTKVFYYWELTDARGANPKFSPIRSFVMPRPLTIAYMGDSYASGEGAPDRNKNPLNPLDKGKWDLDEPCHRSKNSGGELAISKIIREHKEWEIDYINTTCSGATLLNFFTDNQLKSDNTTFNRVQLEQVDLWLSQYRYDGLDILLTDGGGNDMGFAPVAERGLKSIFMGKIDKGLKDYVKAQIEQLPSRYDAVMNYAESLFALGRVIWFNYPDPTKDKTGKMCTIDPDHGNVVANIISRVNPLDCWGPLEKGIHDDDWKFIHDNGLAKLNSEIAKAGQKHGWDLVDLYNRSNRNGLCNCDDPYFNTFGKSKDIQGDEYGTLHPNKIGFKNIYESPLFNQLEKSIEKFQKDYIQDAKRRAIDEAKRKARAKIAWEAIMNQFKDPVKKPIIEVNQELIKIQKINK
ncbi:hypothetical protein MASR1M45_04120 [Candidatus Kapaibacterium sp.]